MSAPTPETLSVGSRRLIFTASPGTITVSSWEGPSSISLASTSLRISIVDFPAKDQGVRMLGFLAQDVFDFIKCLGVAFLIHEHLGAGVADVFAELRVLQRHQFVELGHRGSEILGNPVHRDRAERGDQVHLGAFVFGGFGDLAIPCAGGRQRTLAEGEVGVGDLELGILLGAESAFGLARPDREFLDEVFGLVGRGRSRCSFWSNQKP